MSIEATELESVISLPDDLPLFPLPDHVLFPGVVTPYRVFEPRYVALVQHLMTLPEESRWLAFPRLEMSMDESTSTAPSIASVAVAARMTHCERQLDGLYHIVVEGGPRCVLTEMGQDAPYRRAGITRQDDVKTSMARERVQLLVATICQATFTLMTQLGEGLDPLTALFADVPDPDSLVYRVAGSLLVDAEERQRFLEERCPVVRAQRVVDSLGGVLGLAMVSQEHRPDAP